METLIEKLGITKEEGQELANGLLGEGISGIIVMVLIIVIL